ncbi:hypothetical protein FRC00_001002 [Tulasnella sp. 408]|nr:hypothetical protein FRC00_001002 [Tulasnella sp. 408]
MAELSLAEKAIAALWVIESPAEQIRILKQNDKQFVPSTNFHPLRTDVLNLLFKIIIIKPSGGGSEDPSSRLDPALKALQIFATLVPSVEHPLKVYTIDVWSTKINFFIGSQIAESADTAGKRLPVRSWLLTIVQHVYKAIFTEYRGIFQAERLDHAAVLNLLYSALFHRIDQAHGDPDIRRAIFQDAASILVYHSAIALSFPEVASNAVVKCGPERILERCTDFLSNGFIIGVTSLITHLSQVPAAHGPIFVTGRFHVRLMEKYWAWTENPVEDPEPVSAQSMTFITLKLVGT